MKNLLRSSFKIRYLFVVFMVMSAFSFFSTRVVFADNPSPEEIEQYVRARIDMGENMGNFFKSQKRPQFGPDGSLSMEEQMAKINNFIAKILSKYDLTIEVYQKRSPDVFSDQAGVEKFLESHPDLKSRYEALPQSSRRGH